MKFADGGYIPCPNGTAGMAWGPEPGEYIFARDGRIWRVSDDGERIDRIDAPQEES